MFDLKKLLTSERRRKTGKNENDKRTEHIRDYDRVIFSPFFRRLQDKAQVFPLDKDDFVRTRLTHSLEVATLGRSLGFDIAKSLKEKYNQMSEDDIIAFMNILGTSCLLHDIGNPPFGHFGEESIKTWFKKNNYLDELKLNEQQKNDFLLFEGNAQTLRVITYNDYLSDEYGLNLTYSTLAASIKYPCSSIEIDKTKGKAYKKYGYFFSEKKVFDEIQEKTGLKGNRHPLVYIMEAADDIAYSIIDIEDAIKKGVVSHEFFLDYLIEELSEIGYKELIDKYKSNINEYTKNWDSIYRGNRIAANKFRIEVIGIMFRDCVDVFVDNYDRIMNGKFKSSLIEESRSKLLQEKLTDFARKYVYNNREIILLESLGYEVIHGLLDFFVPAALSSDNNTIKTYHGKIYEILSPALRMLFKKYQNIEDENINYYRLLLVTDYISMMTDSYALHLYRRLSGIKL